MYPRGIVLPAVLALAFTAPEAASAFDNELQLGGDLFYAQQFIDDDTKPLGGGFALRGRYGLSDAIAVAIATSWSGLSMSHEDGSSLRQLVNASAGIQYSIDVFRFIPYLSVLIGVSTTFQDGESQVAFLLEAGGGLDWMATESFSFGVSATYQLTVGRDFVPGALCVSLRLSWHRLIGASTDEATESHQNDRSQL